VTETPYPRNRLPRVHVTLAPALGRLFPDAPHRLALDAATVSDLIDALDARWPGMGDRLRDTSPAVRRHINIFASGCRLALHDRLEDGAAVFILTAVSGG
jgi:sulfur-carrier protein